MNEETKTTYEIRVYRDTRLYFNTHTVQEKNALSLHKHFKVVFAEHDNYKVTLHKHTATSASLIMEKG